MSAVLMTTTLAMVACFLKPMPNGGQEVKFKAMDCSNPGRFRSSNFRQLCQNPDATPLDSQMLTAALLQRQSQRVLRAIRCERRTSILDVVCAVWGHSKLLAAPDIEMREPFSGHDCKQTYERKTFVTDDGDSHFIEVNNQVQYKRILAGQLTPTSNDVECVGGTRRVGNIVHSDVVTMATTTVLVEEINLMIDLKFKTLRDLDKEVNINYNCASARQCMDDNMGYVILDNPSDCPYQILRMGEMERVSIPTPSGIPDTGLVSRLYKYLLRVKGPVQVEASCASLPPIRATNHPSVYVIMDAVPEEIGAQLPGVDADSIDLELEISTSESYLEFRFLELTHQHLSGVLQALCKLSSSTLPELAPSPLHPSRYLHVAGEVVTEVQCTEVTVSAKIGDTPVPWCARDLLPVYYGKDLVFIQAVTRLIVPEVVEVHHNCTMMSRPIFETTKGLFITATPEIKLASIHLEANNSLNLFKFLSRNLSEEYESDWGTSLLYDHQLMKELSSSIHFGMTHTKVIEGLTQAYCSDGSCGSYQPSGTTGFNPTRLMDQARNSLNRLNPAYQLYNWVKDVGSVCSFVLALLGLCRILFWLYGKFCPAIQFEAPQWSRRLFWRARRASAPVAEALEDLGTQVKNMDQRVRDRLHEMQPLNRPVYRPEVLVPTQEEFNPYGGH